MDLTRDALQFIQNTAEPNLVDWEGIRYSDKQLYRVHTDLSPKALEVTTLTSFIEYIISKIDADIKMGTGLLVLVEGPRRVKLYSEIDSDGERENYINAQARLPYIKYDEYMSREAFQIMLQSQFIQNEDRDLLLEYISKIQTGTTAEYGDDGISQKATVKMGSKGLHDVILPNPVTLLPYRTFVDIEQPRSTFSFRVKDDGKNIGCALFEADGGAWRIAAVATIKDYLKKAFSKTDEKYRPVVIG